MDGDMTIEFDFERRGILNTNEYRNRKYYLMCERKWVYHTLMMVAGFFGAYTYLLRGNVFCNAQTGNVVLMGMALGAKEWKEAFYFLIPISAYVFGSFLSELVPNPVKHHLKIRWDTLLIAIEIVVVFCLGFVPISAPVQICQVAINFIASMQYNTFRQVEGIPVATTFATNHIRQIGIGLAKELRHLHSADKQHRVKLANHCYMLFYFLIGSVAGTVSCHLFVEKSIWVTILPLMIVFLPLLRADLVTEKDLFEEKPSGH